MGKSRTIVKLCPQCNVRVAVASKACKCGHLFFITRRSQNCQQFDERRRTSRIRRDKPNFYDSQEFEKKKTKKGRPGRKKSTSHTNINKNNRFQINNTDLHTPSIKPFNKLTTSLRDCRRRLKKQIYFNDKDTFAKLPLGKQHLAALLLADINRKNLSIGGVVNH